MEQPAVGPGQVYRHFKKGTLYEVVCLATHSETNEEMVVYRDQTTERCFVRPLGMFTDYKEDGGSRVKRFALVPSPGASSSG